MTEGVLHGVGGAIIDSSAHHVVTMAQTFGVHPPTYSTGEGKPLIIDQEAVGIFRDETGSAIEITIAFIYPSERDR